MKRFTVVWLPIAEELLIELWLLADDPNAVQRAADQLEKTLANDPDSVGLKLSRGLKEVRIRPIEAIFEVREGDRMVIVHAVRFADPS